MTEKKHKIKLSGKNIVIYVLLIALVIGYYKYTSHKAPDDIKMQDEYTLLMEKDLDTSYPETPTEVVKIYSRMVKCLYKDSLSDKKTESMVKQMRKLFDAELLENNSLEDQMKKLNKEVYAYKNAKKHIINYEIDEKSLKQEEIKGIEYATIIVGFSIKRKKQYTRTNEKFLLVKDAQGLWKIRGWQYDEGETDQTEMEE